MAAGSEKLKVSDFLRLSSSTPVADVRSPGEFIYGHIPGAFNLPLFDDRQRAEVGTIFKKHGNRSAVLRGLELAAPEMAGKLQQALDVSAGNPLMVHCWRGGMRSEAMAWLFSLGGIKTFILDGGYKAYRHFILDDLAAQRKLIVLGGLTGSGKTNILRHLSGKGNPVADLEGLANHKGSAFGAMGQPPQPSSEHFANLLYTDLAPKDKNNPVWVEDESRNIGSVFMPDTFYDLMQRSPVIALMMSIETRLPRLTEEYTVFPKEQLAASVLKISKRLGGERTKEALVALDNDDFATAIRITLEYYDRAYRYGLSKRGGGNVVYIETDTDDVEHNSSLILEAASSLA